MATKLEKELLAVRVKNIKDVEGKTINKVSISGSRFLCSFTDGTWFGLESYEGYDRCIDMEVIDNIGNIYDFKELGLTTDDAIKTMREASDRAWNAARLREDRKLYNELRKKFEKK